jgi:hypothetical protein
MLQRGMRAAGQMSSAGCDAAHAGRVCATAGKAARWGDDLRIEGLGSVGERRIWRFAGEWRGNCWRERCYQCHTVRCDLLSRTVVLPISNPLATVQPCRNTVCFSSHWTHMDGEVNQQSLVERTNNLGKLPFAACAVSCTSCAPSKVESRERSRAVST